MKKAMFLACLFLAACGDGDDDDGASSAAGCTCAALGADFTSGAGTISEIELPSMQVRMNVVPQVVSTDAVLRLFDGVVYLVNRLGTDNVTLIDLDVGQALHQFSTGEGSNPQDVAVARGKLYVPVYELPEVQVWDAANPGNMPVARIDLAPYVLAAENDFDPEAASAYAVGDRVFVTLAHLGADFKPKGNASAVVIDATTDTVVSEFDLPHENANSFLKPYDGALALSLTTYSSMMPFPPTGSCLARIQTADPPSSTMCVATMDTLGGAISGWVEVGDAVYAQVTATDGTRTLERFTPGGSSPEVVVASDLSPGDMALCEATGQILFADTSAGVLRVYDTKTGEVSSSPEGINIGLPPAFAGGIACHDEG